MAGPSFKWQASSDADLTAPLARKNGIYVLEDAAAGSWCAFLLRGGSGNSFSNVEVTDQANEALDFEEAAEQAGTFFFAHEAPDNINQAFLDEWETYLLDQRIDMGVLLFLAFMSDPDDPVNSLNTHLLQIYKPDNYKYSLKGDTEFNLCANYLNLNILEDTRVEFEASNDRSYAEFKLTKSGGHPIEFFMNGIPLQAQTGLHISIPVNGPGSGSIRFELSLFVNTDLQQLETGQKCYFQDEDAIRQLFYPLIGQVEQVLPDNESFRIFFQASIDPSDPLNEKNTHQPRTYFAFTGNSEESAIADQGLIPTELNSYFTTNKGYEITLFPQMDPLSSEAEENTLFAGPYQARLEFQGNTADLDNYHLVPAGDFQLHVVSQEESIGAVDGFVSLLLGLSGMENIAFKADLDCLRFWPDMGAFATRFPPVAANHLNIPRKDDPSGLTADYKTSWCNVISKGDHAIHYFSQPEGTPLYTEETSEELLEYFPIAAVLPQAADFQIPILSPAALYQTLQGESELIKMLEIDVISEVRRKLVVEHASSPTATSGNNTFATTPSGAIAEIDPQGNWEALRLGEDDDSKSFSFHHLDGSLATALQANQQFLVITSADKLGQLLSELEDPDTFNESVKGFRNQLSIQGWPFNISVGQNNRIGDYRNVLIFKNCRGTIKEFIASPEKWTQARDFNDAEEPINLQVLSRWMQDYVDAALQQSDNPDFKYFNDIVDDPDWNGILALRVDIDLENIPPELMGLIGGIDLNQFYAHHFGIEINRVRPDNLQITFEEPSSLFALINYVDPGYKLLERTNPEALVEVPDDTTYLYKVLTLKVLFQNSRIQKFASKLQVSLSSILDERVFHDLPEDPLHVEEDNTPDVDISMLLLGSAAEKDGTVSYTFKSAGYDKFWMDSNLINFMEMELAEFVTLPSSVADRIEARFSFFGNLDFVQLEGTGSPFDLLSWGSYPGQEAATSKQGLSFKHLWLDLNFDLETPTVVNYKLRNDKLKFYPKDSPTRDTAFFGRFPLEFKGFHTAEHNKTPHDLGFLPVNAAGLPVNTINDTWYGMEFKVNMGSPGALASDAGFNSTMLIAWNPGSGAFGDPNYDLFVGLKLPGAANNASMLSIQGLLKLSIADIDLVYDDTGKYYLLKLHDIGLQFFGLLKIPPGGNTSFYLFGNPDVDSPNSLGWYAAYNKTS